MKYGNFFVRLRDLASYASASERAHRAEKANALDLKIAELNLTIADIDMAGHGESGNSEPLARHIEAGGNLGPQSRRTLVRILRGELRFSRGARRTYAQALADMRVTEEVRGFQRHFAIRHGWRGSRASAIRRRLTPHRNR